MTQQGAAGTPDPHSIDVQRREIVVHTMSSQDGADTVAIDKLVRGGDPKRLLQLSKFDAQQLKDALEAYLKTIDSKELAGLNTTLSPKDMLELFGEDDN